MASNPRKSLPTQTASPDRKPVNETLNTNKPFNRTTSESPTPQSTPNTSVSNGLNRTSTIRSATAPMSARSAARKPPLRGNSGLGGRMKSVDSSYDENSRADHAQLVDELKLQVQRAEIASEQYQKEVEVLQLRLHEAVGERNNLEAHISQKDVEVANVQTEAMDILRQKKELEQSHHAEKEMMLKEREHQVNKEQELQNIIQRLNETIRQKEMRAHVEGERPILSRSGMFVHD
jgi:hypothetical protein